MAAAAVAHVGVALLLGGDVRRLAVRAIGALFLGSVSIVFVVVNAAEVAVWVRRGSTSLGLLPGRRWGARPTGGCLVVRPAMVSARRGVRGE